MGRTRRSYMLGKYVCKFMRKIAGKVYGYLTVSRLPNYMEEGDSPIAQESICRKLFMWMQSAPQIKLPVAILQETAKRYRVKHEDFMPFLKYFIVNHSSRDSKA